MDNFEKELHRIGLAGNEAKVYLELLHRGSLSAQDLSHKMGMDRTLSYTVLNHLITKGLVRYIVKNKKRYFEAAHPKALFNSLHEQEAILKSLVPQLEKLEKIQEISQEIQVYEGKEGLRSVIHDFFSSQKSFAFGSTGKAYDLLLEMPYLAKKIKEEKKDVRIIIGKKYVQHRMMDWKGVKFRFLDVESEATTVIVEDKIAIFLIDKEILVTVIKNPIIARSYQQHFKVLWNAAKPLNSY